MEKDREKTNGEPLREETQEQIPEVSKPEVNPVDTAELEERLKKSEAENARLRAEFQNYRNAVERESQEQIKRGKERIILKLIVIDKDLKRALENSKDKEDGFVTGVKLISKSLEKLLADEGVSLIEPEIGKPFDPFAHEVEETFPTNDVPDMAVYKVIESGYNLNGKVLKPARVVVALNVPSTGE